MPNYKGKILVARPQLMSDKLFTKSVVYIYEHKEDVIMGLILNKNSNLKISDIYKMKGVPNSGATGIVYKGGPVADQSLLLLHTDEWSSQNTIHVGSGLALSSDEVMLQKLLQGNTPKDYRLFAGMSTWVTPQLDEEMFRYNAWQMMDPQPTLFFNSSGEQQWNYALKVASHQFVANL